MAGMADRLRAAGAVAWSLVGVVLLLAAAGLLVVVLRPILLALVVALFLAIAFMPVVDAVDHRGVPRAAGAVAALLIVIALAAGATALVVWGVLRQKDEIRANVDAAASELGDVDPQSVYGSADVLLAGLAPVLSNLLGTVVGVALGLYSSWVVPWPGVAGMALATPATAVVVHSVRRVRQANRATDAGPS
ncbi:hypothetical protein [Phytohabitans rumicis]|nr:hypothetical protein [Phytohabitans rumicis]